MGTNRKAAKKENPWRNSSERRMGNQNYNWWEEGWYDQDSNYGKRSYYSRRQSGTTSKYRGFSWNSWFNNDDVTLIKEEKLCIKESLNYSTPSNKVVDIEIPPKIRGEQLVQARKIMKNLSRLFYHRLMEEEEDKIYSKEYEITEDKELSEDQLKEIQLYKSIYEQSKLNEIPGFTPLDKASNLFRELMRTNEDFRNQMCPNAGQESGKKASQKQGQGNDPLQTIEENFSTMQWTEEFSDPVFNELCQVNKFSKEVTFDILDRISIFKGFGKKFDVKLEVDEERTEVSRLKASKRMRSYTDVVYADMYQHVFPDFAIKLAKKDMNITVPVTRNEHKQKIIILLDYSGSMMNLDKQAWVCAILLDRLRYAIKEECEIFFSYFVSSINKLHFHHIYDKDSAFKFWSKFSTYPNGGTTRIADMVNHINKEVYTHKRLHNLDIDLSKEKVELLIINDGQDTVHTKKFPYKTNAITIQDGVNNHLKDLCLQNKGKYVWVRGGLRGNKDPEIKSWG